MRGAKAFTEESFRVVDVLIDFLTVYGVVPASFSFPTLITSMFLHGSWSHVIGNMPFATNGAAAYGVASVHRLGFPAEVCAGERAVGV